MMNEQFNPFMAFLPVLSNNYDERLVENTKLENGLVVDTVWRDDFNKFETAIQDFSTHFIPVERYETKEESVAGHKKWVEIAEQNPKTIPYLGCDYLMIEDKEHTVVYEDSSK